MAMFDLSTLLGNDIEKWNRLESTESSVAVIKEDVIDDMVYTLIVAMAERKINGFEMNEKAIEHLIKAHNEFIKDKNSEGAA